MKSLIQSLQESVLDIDANITGAQAGGEEWKKANEMLVEIFDELLLHQLGCTIFHRYEEDIHPYVVYFEVRDLKTDDPKWMLTNKDIAARYVPVMNSLIPRIKRLNKFVHEKISDVQVLKTPGIRIINAKAGVQKTFDKYIEIQYNAWLVIKVGPYFRPAVDNFIKKHNIK